MDTATKLQCRHCERTTHLSEYNARISGWRIWSGTTMGGRQASDVVCPYCAGTREAL